MAPLLSFPFSQGDSHSLPGQVFFHLSVCVSFTGGRQWKIAAADMRACLCFPDLAEEVTVSMLSEHEHNYNYLGIPNWEKVGVKYFLFLF